VSSNESCHVTLQRPALAEHEDSPLLMRHKDSPHFEKKAAMRRIP